jgi:hypothetical protein
MTTLDPLGLYQITDQSAVQWAPSVPERVRSRLMQRLLDPQSPSKSWERLRLAGW